MKPSSDWQRWEPHGSQAEHKDHWQDFQEPQKEWRDFDRMQGHKRFEFKADVKSVISFIGKLFRRKS